MQTQTINLIYFSPTKGTKKIVRAIGSGTALYIEKEYSITREKTAPITLTNDKTAIIGMPVYGGRLPLEAVERLSQFRGTNTPAILAVVYGNRHYDDALLELNDLVTAQGFNVIAGGAFIAIHSFSTAENPIAPDRPNAQDMQTAKAFGQKAIQKLKNQASLQQPQIPGSYPYKERKPMPAISPVTDSAICTLCKACENICPTHAIFINEEVSTDKDLCIWCNACVRACPEDARTFNAPQLISIAQRLSTNFYTPKQPEIFL
jgi:ferredoxin